MAFSIDRTAVIYDVIDGDIVVIHLESGNYYNLTGSGAALWASLANGATVEQMVGKLAAKYDGETGVMESDLKAFLAHLQEEGMIVEQEEAGDDMAVAGGDKEAYQPPVLEVFTDMQDFLLVDPIHEVDEQGLPKYTPPDLNEG